MNDAEKRKILGEAAALKLGAMEAARQAQSVADRATQPNADDWTRADFTAWRNIRRRQYPQALADIDAWAAAAKADVTEQYEAGERAAEVALTWLMPGVKSGTVRKTSVTEIGEELTRAQQAAGILPPQE